MKAVQEFLRALDRHDLALLLSYSTYELSTQEVFLEIETPAVAVFSPQPFAEALGGLSEQDQRRIREAIIATDPAARAHGPTEIAFLAGDAPDGGMAERQVLLAEVFVLRYQMIAVATGKVGLNEVDDYYRVRRRRVHEGLVSLGLDDPNPFPSLWDWYRHWKATFNSYAERRRYVKDLYSSLVERLSAPAGEVAVVPRELTGWERVDRSLRKAQDQLARARDEEDFQAIGLLCRELLISVAQAVYDPTCHASADGVMPSSTDAKRMIAAFLDATVPGSSNETLRRAVRSAVELAVELQHRRTAAFRDAALCMETASSIVNMLAILAGKRDPVV